MAALAVTAALLSGRALSGEASSERYRLIGSVPATTAAAIASPARRLYVVGCSGQPVGIAAGANASVVSGCNSNRLPTDRIFQDGVE